MSAKIIALDPEPPVHPDVVALLTDICGAVERDDVSALGVAIVHRDGATGTCWSTAPNLATLIGAVERLKHRLLMATTD